MRKSKIIIFTAILTVILFITLIALDKKAANFTQKVKVLYSITNISKGSKLNKINFRIVSVDIDKIPVDAVTSFDEIKNKYAADNIYSNEPLNKKRLTDKNIKKDLILEPNMRKFSIPMTYIDDPFAGTLREGDVVDILHTTMPSATNSNTTTTVMVQQAHVLGAIDANGNFLSTSNKNTLAVAILFEGDLNEAAELTNKQYAGKYKFVQVPLNGTRYSNVTVQNGN